MAWVSGTCTGHLELLDALKTFLTSNAGLVAAGQAWVLMRDVIEDEYRTLYFKGTGLAGEDEIYIGLQEYKSTTNDVYNWVLNGFTGYIENLTFWNQPGAMLKNSSGYNVTLTLSNTEIKYWLIANGRRVIIVCRVNAVYVAAYLGLFLPASRPDQYPYPLFIGGNCGSTKLRYSYTGSENTNFWSPNYGGISSSLNSSDIDLLTAYVLCGSYIPIFKAGNTGLGGDAYPERIGYVHDIMEYYKIYIQNALPNIDDSRFGYSVQMVSKQAGIHGELDGVIITQGASLNAEDVITLDGSQYLMIPNTYRTSIDSYAAIFLG